MYQRRILRYLSLSLLILALLTLITWSINTYALPILPTTINQTILISIGIVLGLSGLLARLNSIVELFVKIFGNETNQEEKIEFLKFTVEKACAKYIDVGNYQAQINIRLYAGKEDIYLKTIRLIVFGGFGFANYRYPIW